MREEGQLDVLAEQAPEHLLHAEHELPEVDDPGLEHLLAAERQQLSSELGRPLARPPNFFDVGARGIAGLQLVANERV